MSDESLDKKIDSWKEKLLDLSRRNNMVDFSATKTKSLPTKDTDRHEIAAQLAGDDDLYVWKPDPDEKASSDENTENQNTDLQQIARDVIDESSDTRDENAESEEYSDDLSRPSNELISIRDPEETDNSLYNISLNQRKYLQEKGVDPLYLALGMLEWYSVDYSDTKLRSPLFLVSVSIERETVSDQDRHDYVLSSDNDVILNPALRKKLKSERDINLPANDEFDLTDLETTEADIADAISGFRKWGLTNAVVLGIFDFAKLGLYNDLEENRDTVKSNPIVRALHGDPSELNTDAGSVPDAAKLDEEVPPRDTFQVLEADSSQQVAIEAAKAGVSFVLQGPPGTGKSQTIANIIAEKLAANKTVLFVSEKQAALDVVKNRLDDVGLGRFCLPAHGKNASKDAVLTSLERELNAPPIKEPNARLSQKGRLRKRRAEINEYGNLILTEYGEIETSAYEAHGILADHQDTPSPGWRVSDPFSVSEEQFQTAANQLEQLSAFHEQLDIYGNHPWSYLTLTNWQLDTKDRVRENLREQREILEEASQLAELIDQKLGVEFESISSLDDEIIPLLERIQSAPNVEWSTQWFDPSFYQQENQVKTLANLHEKEEQVRAELLDHYERSFFEEDGSKLNADLSEHGLLRFVSPSYRRLKRRILSHADEGYDPGLSQLKEDTRQLMELESLADERDKYDDLTGVLGHLYDGTDTDWDLVLSVQSWIAEVSNDSRIDLDDIQSFLSSGPDEINDILERARSLNQDWGKVVESFQSFINTDSITTESGDQIYEASFDETKDTLSSLESHVPELKDWIQFNQALTEVRNTVAGDYLDVYFSTDIGPNNLVKGFEKDFYTRFVNEIYDQTELGQFNSGQHEKVLERFRKLDKKQQELDKIEIQHRVTSRRPSMSIEHASSSQQVVLRREIEKQRRLKPLRELFDEAGDMITRLKPCFMMSPLSVAQHLKTGSIEFDCVIFDEASQIMPQDAISSIIRADQAVFAGDTKQLPPTQFFDADVEANEDVREDLESILEEAAATLPEKHLRWHYRSRTDELIEFSNRKYYSGRLNTFPENDPNIETGVQFEYVPEGIYDRGGSRQNMPEARRIVDEIEALAESSPDKSVGVVAFSQAQERAIRDVIEERRTENQDLDAFVDERDALEGFFVKNLESVQGDERDVMLFSVGYGPDQSGKITMNFGPLNNDGGERRLNVAVTRAREEVVVFSSLQPGDIDLSRTNARGVKDFKHYLEYAKKGERALIRDDEPADTLAFDSAFEEAVYNALEAEGHDVETQIQSSGYSIDLAIRHPRQPGNYVLGIECDGAAYHSSKTARDRDRTRQMILEDLGWTIHRIWSPDWASQRKKELEAINEKIELMVDEDSTTREPTVDVSVTEAEPETVDPVEIDGGQTIFRTYEEPEINRRPDKDFEDISNRMIGNELAALVEAHGPIERDRAFKEVVRQWQFSRVGKSMRRTLTGITNQLDGGRIVTVDGFLWPTGIEEVPVRVNNGDDSRSVEEIPIEELAKAGYIILENGIAMDHDDLVLETARKFGWQRRGKKIKQRIQRAIEYLLELDAVSESEQLTAEGIDIDSRILDDIYD